MTTLQTKLIDKFKIGIKSKRKKKKQMLFLKEHLNHMKI